MLGSSNGKQQQRRIKVLIIDDEKDLVDLLAMRFKLSGSFVVDKAFDGEMGLDRLKTFRPDLVLLDILMPGIDGWEVCRRIREDQSMKDLPLMVMTALSGSAVEDRARAAGVVKYFTKPFDGRQLVKQVQEAVA